MVCGGPTAAWEDQPPELEPIDTIGPDDEVINLVMDEDDDDEDITTIESDMDNECEEVVFTTPELSDSSQTDTRPNDEVLDSGSAGVTD